MFLRRLWSKQVLYSVAIIVLGYLVWRIFNHISSLKVINFLTAWIPLAISLLLAFVPEARMTPRTKMFWRCSVIFIGVVWSSLLWRQQVVTEAQATHDQTEVVDQAVQQSNDHSDKRIGLLQQDVEGMKGDLRSAIAQSASDITKTIGNIKPSVPKLENQNPPDVGLQFVNPKDVMFQIVNLSDEIVRSPKYWFILCDLDAPDGHAIDILRIPAKTLDDYLPKHQAFMPTRIAAVNLDALKDGDRVTGYVAVQCPDCKQTRYYWLFYRQGLDGWYGELPGQPADKAVGEVIEKSVTDSDAALRVFQITNRKDIPEP